MYEAGIEVTDADFEFAKPPLSKKFLCLVFEKYQLDFIAYFGENMFYYRAKFRTSRAPVSGCTIP